MHLAIFPFHLSKVLRLPRKNEARSYEMLHLSSKIILANLKIWCSKMQPAMCFAPQRHASFHLHTARWLRTGRFSKPAFRPSGGTNHRGKKDSRLFYLFAHLHLLSSDSTLSLLWSSFFFSSLHWLFPPLLFHLSILLDSWLLNFLRKNVCMYVCLYVCMYVCMNACMLCMFVCMHACMYVCVLVYVFVTLYVYVHVHVSVDVNVYVYVCKYVSMFVCKYVCM